MRNSQAQASRDFAIRQAGKRRFYSEAGTGSIIDETQSAPYQAALRNWDLLIPVAVNSQGGSYATTGAIVVVIKNCAASSVAPAAREFNLETALPPAALSPASVMDRVRTVFGLNMSETAEVFDITRQTAYQWTKFSEMEQVRAYVNRDRLKQLYGAAQSWQTLPPLKGRWLHAFLPAGNTVLDLLKAPQIDLKELQSAYHALAAGTAIRRSEEGVRATQAATALAGAFGGLGAGRKARKG